MSYYYNYSIGYILDGKIYPIGPFNCEGKPRDVLTLSGSIASDLHEDFYIVSDDMISEKFKKAYCEDTSDGELRYQFKYLPVAELPKESYIRKGYFLIKDVQLYEESMDSDGLFYEHLTPTAYAAKVKNELIFGAPEKEYDCEGEEIERYNAADFMFYAFPDYESREYEAAVLRVAAEVFEFDIPKGGKLVVVENEG